MAAAVKCAKSSCSNARMQGADYCADCIAYADPRVAVTPVRFGFSAELVNAPRDVQALACIAQVLNHLQLSAEERLQVTRFAAQREEIQHG